MKNHIETTIELVEARIESLVHKLDVCSESEVSNIQNQIRKAVRYKNELSLELNKK